MYSLFSSISNFEVRKIYGGYIVNTATGDHRRLLRILNMIKISVLRFRFQCILYIVALLTTEPVSCSQMKKKQKKSIFNISYNI